MWILVGSKENTWGQMEKEIESSYTEFSRLCSGHKQKKGGELLVMYNLDVVSG